MHCPSYAYPAEQSKLLVLSSASFFNCWYSFDFSYPLSFTKVSLDCASLECQTNRWKASTAVIRNTDDLEIFASHLKIAWYWLFSIVMFYKVIWNGRNFWLKFFYFRNEIKCAQERFVEGRKRSICSLRTRVLLCSQHTHSFIKKSLVLRISWLCKSNVA